MVELQVTDSMLETVDTELAKSETNERTLFIHCMHVENIAQQATATASANGVNTKVFALSDGEDMGMMHSDGETVTCTATNGENTGPY